MLLNYTGYTFIFKAPMSKVTDEEIRKELGNINCKSEGAWEVNIVKFSNQSEQFEIKKATNVYTVHDSLLGSKVAVMYKDDAKGTYAYKGDIDVLLRTLGLKQAESLSIRGTNHKLGDVIYSVGEICKNGTISNEVVLRIELRSMVSFGVLDRKIYETLMEDLLNVLGKTIKQAFLTKDYPENLSIFLPRDSTSLTLGSDQGPKQLTETPKNKFDQRNIANLYCYFLLNLPVVGV